ncbi:hypothetical protein IFM89_015364 [Coptis chinensis]|uniref:TF-B3 domain-containing protein n=1 Tax=Coptis chinensis TaxID=261450 RepID=A0A835IC98_9MAGN|nr:hypothetical protein IFM89_015364 [Coptis chinensis]
MYLRDEIFACSSQHCGHGNIPYMCLLPKAFIVKYFDDNVPRNFILRRCTRRSWTVSVKKVDDGVFLCNEWQTFVKQHALEVGDFLVFRYNGNSEFSVKIYGKDACEKEIPLAQDLYGDGSRCTKQEARMKQTTSEVSKPLVAQGKERTYSATTEFTSEYPFCKITMRRSFVGWSFELYLPALFAKKYLKDAPTDRDVTSNFKWWYMAC